MFGDDDRKTGADLATQCVSQLKQLKAAVDAPMGRFQLKVLEAAAFELSAHAAALDAWCDEIEAADLVVAGAGGGS